MIYCLVSSLGLEITGIFSCFHSYDGVSLSGSVVVGAIAYIVSVLLMIASPFCAARRR